MSKNYYGCGGALIAPDLVLTSARCGDYTGEVVKISAHNVENLNGKADLRTCVQWEQHPGYVGIGVADDSMDDFLDYDFALCKLDVPIYIDEDNGILVLNEDPSIPKAGDTVTTMGFGRLQYQGSPPKILNEVSMPVVSNNKCSALTGWEIRDMKFCAGNDNPQANSCNNDWGGPVVLIGDDGTHLHVGLNSYGDKCGVHGDPDIKARTSSGIEWIKETACDLDSVFCEDTLPTSEPTLYLETEEPTFEPTYYETETDAPTIAPTIAPTKKKTVKKGPHDKGKKPTPKKSVKSENSKSKKSRPKKTVAKKPAKSKSAKSNSAKSKSAKSKSYKKSKKARRR
jgi:secreted trypsin-like serine protease